MPVIQALEELVAKHPAIGFGMSDNGFAEKGHLWNHKKVYRSILPWTEHRRRHKKRLPARIKQALYRPESINQVWSIDFMSDSLGAAGTFGL
ncbi:hypothetical protein V8V91_21815 [Algoriphagus halophilus]|uniref:hypothetical protein n=1 Tax=Algoriphagus halophilus TaxID=226505 RepID=UPI00358EE696